MVSQVRIKHQHPLTEEPVKRAAQIGAHTPDSVVQTYDDMASELGISFRVESPPVSQITPQNPPTPELRETRLALFAVGLLSVAPRLTGLR